MSSLFFSYWVKRSQRRGRKNTQGLSLAYLFPINASCELTFFLFRFDQTPLPLLFIRVSLSDRYELTSRFPHPRLSTSTFLLGNFSITTRVIFLLHWFHARKFLPFSSIFFFAIRVNLDLFTLAFTLPGKRSLKFNSICLISRFLHDLNCRVLLQQSSITNKLRYVFSVYNDDWQDWFSYIFL